jgi:membrane dipeptidase
MDRTAIEARDPLERARQIHAEHVVVDSLAPTFTCEMALTPTMVELARRLQAEGKSRAAIRVALAEALVVEAASDPSVGATYLDYWKRSGVTAASSTVYNSGPPSRAWDEALAEIGRGNRLIQALGGALVAAGSSADVRHAHRDGRHAVIYNLQNAEPIGEDLDRVDVFYGLGVRIVQITYNLRNRFGDGCAERRDGGLSRLGVALVERLNQRRVLIDVSHLSDQTALDALEVSRQPIACTHTAARVISHHARAKPDTLLRVIAERGGYVGVLILPTFLLPPDGDRHAGGMNLPDGWATLETVVDHVVHLLDVVGAEHLGIGTDWGKPYYQVARWSSRMVREEAAKFDWIGWRPEDRFDPNAQVQGLETWDLWPNLTAALLHRGIPEDTVVKIIGENFLRVFGEVCGP